MREQGIAKNSYNARGTIQNCNVVIFYNAFDLNMNNHTDNLCGYFYPQFKNTGNDSPQLVGLHVNMLRSADLFHHNKRHGI